jgi:hypothetical protein
MLSLARAAASVFQQCLLSGLGSTGTLISSPTRRPTSALSLFISRDSSCLFVLLVFHFVLFLAFFFGGDFFFYLSVGRFPLSLFVWTCACRLFVQETHSCKWLSQGKIRGTAAQPRDAFMLRQVLQIESWIRSASQAWSNPVEYSYGEEKRRHSKNTGIELIFLAQPQDAPVSRTDFQMFIVLYCLFVFWFSRERKVWIASIQILRL